MMSILFGLRLVVFFHHFKDFGLHSQQTANVQRISGAILLALHSIEAIIHVLADELHTHIAASCGNLSLQFIHIQILRTEVEVEHSRRLALSFLRGFHIYHQLYHKDFEYFHELIFPLLKLHKKVMLA